MSGLLRRIRRPGAAEETRTEPIVLPDPAHGSAPSPPADGADGQRLPAGVAPEDLERRSTTRPPQQAAPPGALPAPRARARPARPRRPRLRGPAPRAGRAARSSRRRSSGWRAIDAELRDLEAALGTPRGETILREPGVGGTCPRCGELHASDATFCAHCGANLAEAAAEAEPAKQARRRAGRAAADAAAASRPRPTTCRQGRSGDGAAPGGRRPHPPRAAAAEPAATPASAARAAAGRRAAPTPTPRARDPDRPA